MPFVSFRREVDFLGGAARRLATAEMQNGSTAAARRLVRFIDPGIVSVDRARRQAEHVLHRKADPALLVVFGANVASPLLAVAALSLSVACINSTEGAFWATATTLGKSNPGAAGGVLNFMGNLGGVVSIWAVPRMKDAWGWTAMLGFWAAVAVASALLWLLIRPGFSAKNSTTAGASVPRTN